MTSSISEAHEPHHHLLISGTGRAGTSFLVKYFSALGFDTGLQKSGSQKGWDDTANAGLEHVPLIQPDDDLPYVVKLPYISEYFAEIIESGRFAIDALLIPVRDLTDAASSRAIVESQVRHRNDEWRANKLETRWEIHGVTPGGVVFSLDPLDQARILAVSFYRLVYQAVSRDIPLIFLAFPKIIEDWRYLHRMLLPVLPTSITPAMAQDAHAAVASAAMVRVGRECGISTASLQGELRPHYPSAAEIDNAALRRELTRVREERDADRDQLARLQSEFAGASEERDANRDQVARLQSEFAGAREERDAKSDQLARLQSEFERVREEVQSANTMIRKNNDVLQHKSALARQFMRLLKTSLLRRNV